MREKRKLKEYDPKTLESLAKSLIMLRQASEGQTKPVLKLDGLQQAIWALDKVDRERIEKFWGLTGGPNHSKKLGHTSTKDVAFAEMCRNAVLSLRKLLTLDYLVIYDASVSRQIDLIATKVNFGGLEISDMECIKYLMAFFIYAENGPKMSFEEDPMSIDTDLNENFLFDECEVLNQMWGEFQRYEDKSINIRLLVSFFEMIDFKDMLTIKKSIGIEIPKESLPEGFRLDEIESVRTVSQIRELKETIFPYGAWEVVTDLILCAPESNLNMDDFWRKLNFIRKNWSRVAEFKTGEKTLKTGNEIRTLSVYNIGGLEFTDIYEVMFIYLELNLIAPKL